MQSERQTSGGAAVGGSFSRLRVAIVHYWFVSRGGGERVVEALAEMFPQADLFTPVCNPAALGPALAGHKITTSFLQRLPAATRVHRHLLPLQPLALEQFDLSGYDLVISSESGPAKGVLTSPRCCHICYCHSPMRYLWDMHAAYRRGMGPLVGTFFTLASHYLRLWDYASAGRVDHFVANSRFVAARIAKIYGRLSTVIHPPVNIPPAAMLSDGPGDYYLAAGRLVDYKRFDLAVEACTRLGRRLRVVGVGPELRRLRQLAGPTVEFTGAVDDAALQREFAHCRALLFPGEEDFGIVPVEAQSFGRPVIAYGSGGALETVRAALPGSPTVLSPTGLFFGQQSVAGLMEAMERFEATEREFSPAVIRRHALQFAKEGFQARMAEFVCQALGGALGSSRAASALEFTPALAATAHLGLNRPLPRFS